MVRSVRVGVPRHAGGPAVGALRPRVGAGGVDRGRAVDGAGERRARHRGAAGRARARGQRVAGGGVPAHAVAGPDRRDDGRGRPRAADTGGAPVSGRGGRRGRVQPLLPAGRGRRRRRR